MGEEHVYVALLYCVASFICMLNTPLSHTLKKSSVNLCFIVK